MSKKIRFGSMQTERRILKWCRFECHVQLILLPVNQVKRVSQYKFNGQ